MKFFNSFLSQSNSQSYYVPRRSNMIWPYSLPPVPFTYLTPAMLPSLLDLECQAYSHLRVFTCYTCSFLCQETSSSRYNMAPKLTSFKSLLRCLLFSEAFSDHTNESFLLYLAFIFSMLPASISYRTKLFILLFASFHEKIRSMKTGTCILLAAVFPEPEVWLGAQGKGIST